MMTDRQYLTLRQRVLAEYERERRKIEAVYASKIVSLDTVWLLSGGDVRKLNNASAAMRTTDLAQQVTKVIPRDGAEFSADDICQQIAMREPSISAFLNRKSVANVLSRLVQDEVIEVVEHGRGRVLTRYRATPLAEAQRMMQTENNDVHGELMIA